MELSGVLSAASRRVIGAVGLAAILAASAGLAAQEPAQQQPAAAQEDPLKFAQAEHRIIVWLIKPDQASNFSLAWQTIKAELKKMGDPGLTAFADSIKILRVDSAPGEEVTFLFDLNPASTSYSYNPVTLLYTTLAENADKPGVGLTYDRATEIYGQIKDAYTNIVPWRVTEVR